MNVNKLIVDTLKPLVSAIKENVYEGEEKTYIIFNYADDRGVQFEDDEPVIDAASMQIHLFCPKNFSYITLKKQIRSRLFKAGFSYPKVTTLYENSKELNHIIFECEIEGNSETEE